MGASFFHPSWPVLYEDNHLLGLYKPAGLLVQGDATGDACLLDLGKQWLKMRYRKPGNVFLGLVHRLDRPVAGAMVFAKTSKAAARLSEQFRSRKTEKRYLAVVEGRLSAREGRLVHYLGKAGRSVRATPDPSEGARRASLRYKVLDAESDRSLISIFLETGRKHQIRAQLAAIGHPVVGDLRYGGSAPLPRGALALLASSLAFTHPVRREPVVLSVPPPVGWPWRGGKADPAPPWHWKDLAASGMIPE